MIVRVLILALFVAILDQASKWLMLEVVMAPPQIIPVTDFFNLVLVYNTGVSFGFLGGGGRFGTYGLIALSILIIGGLLVWVRRLRGWPVTLAAGLIVGGATGNVADRIFRPGVVDFLDFYVGAWHWPAFNLADSSIVLGVIFLLLDGLFEPRGEGKEE
jgi:signal peptidase II|tara:strand:- start:3008 stop:3484 length:477 start_codon:yes stop_codon:yes gene_type:complete